MFHIFMGNPSTSEGLSLDHVISTRKFSCDNSIGSVRIHVSLLRDELHGPLDLGNVSLRGMNFGSRTGALNRIG